MPAIKQYCTIEDAKKMLPLLTSGMNQKIKITGDSTLLFYCKMASTAMDRYFSQNGYVTPIDFGTEGEDNYDELLAESLRQIALNRVCSDILKATGKVDFTEMNSYEMMFQQDLLKILRRDFPSMVQKQEGIDDVIVSSVGIEKTTPWFGPYGVNYDVD